MMIELMPSIPSYCPFESPTMHLTYETARIAIFVKCLTKNLIGKHEKIFYDERSTIVRPTDVIIEITAVKNIHQSKWKKVLSDSWYFFSRALVQNP